VRASVRGSACASPQAGEIPGGSSTSFLVRSWAHRTVHRHHRGARVDGCRRRRAASTPGRGRNARDEVRNHGHHAVRGGAGSRGVRRQDRLPVLLGGLGETVAVPQGRTEHRDSSLRSSAGFAGCGVLGRARSLRLRTLPASLPRNAQHNPAASTVLPTSSYKLRRPVRVLCSRTGSKCGIHLPRGSFERPGA
jgi:hypothetical protein